jgi:hypothetical protein
MEFALNDMRRQLGLRKDWHGGLGTISPSVRVPRITSRDRLPGDTMRAKKEVD